MKTGLYILIILFAFSHLYGQISVTFQMDLEDLTKKGLFSDKSGDELYIRGSFNDWNGNDFKLKKSPDSYLYKGTFLFENLGDTISYKFVIIKNNKQVFWESNPDPKNPENGNRKLIINKNKIITSPTRFHYDEYIKYPVIFSEKKLKEDYLQFRNILETTHPALYDYSSKKIIDSIFETNYKQINSDLEFSEFLILMTEVISKVGCGHSRLWVPWKFWNVAPAGLFPLKLITSNNKTYVKGSFSDNQDIPIGSEIISVNNQPIQIIIKRLEELTSADGFNASYKKARVAYNFSIKYAFAYGLQENFTVEYATPGNSQKMQKTVSPVSKEDIDKGLPKRTELSYNQVEDIKTGVLTINTFAYYRKVKMFHSFIDSVFQEVNTNGIKNLIIDLRGNKGGDPFCSYYLWSYLEPEPLPYFEDHYGKYDTLANPIPKPINNFTGELYILIDGHGFSTTGHFCGLLKYHNIGTFIGSELGATYTCTGNTTYPPLKNTGIMVGTARVGRYSTAVKNMDPMRGVLPNYPIELTQDDIIKGKDSIMDFTLSLIRSKL